MKKFFIACLLLITIALSACGLNPAERLEEAAAEKISETIIEQATGIEDVEINSDGDSISYSIENEDGTTVDVDLNTATNISTITDMGLTIDLPDGLTDGAVQRVEEEGSVSIATYQFSVENLTVEEFYEHIHQEFTANGLSYVNTYGTGATEPDLSNPDLLNFASYQNEEEGIIASIIWGETNIIIGFTKE